MPQAYRFFLLLAVCAMQVRGEGFELIRERGLTGLKSSSGAIVIQPKYEALGWKDGTYSPIEQVIGYKLNGLWGLINLKEERITEPRYLSIEPIGQGRFICSSKGSFSNKKFFGVIDAKGKAKVGFQYEYLESIGTHLIAAQSSAGTLKVGLIDFKEQPVIPLHYKRIKKLNSIMVSVSGFDDRDGVYTTDGTRKVDFILDQIEKLDWGSFVIKSDGKFGILSGNGEITVPLIYKKIEKGPDRKAMLTSFPMWTATDLDRNSQFEVAADDIMEMNDGQIGVRANDRWMILDATGDQVINEIYEEIEPIDDSFFLVRKNEKYGVSQTTGKPVIKAENDSIIPSGAFFLVQKDRYWQLFNKYGRRVTNANFDKLMPSAGTLIPFKRRGFWGYLDSSGDVAIHARFDSVGNFQDSWAITENLNHKGIINSFGNWIIRPEFDSLVISEGLAIGAARGTWTLINKVGRVLFRSSNPMQWHDFGVLVEAGNHKKGLFSFDGRFIVDATYDSISSAFAGKYCIVSREAYAKLIDDRGDAIITTSADLEGIYHISEDRIGVRREGRFGYLDIEGRIRIANQYEAIGPWSEDRGIVMLKGKWGVVDENEALVAQPYYDEIEPFKNGVARARKDGFWGLLNKDGEVVIPCEYDHIERLKSQDFLIRKGTKYGLADSEGRISIRVNNDYLDHLGSSLYKVSRRGKVGIKNSKNVDLLPASFEEVLFLARHGLLLARQKSTQITIELP